jgi:hypothetical protein
MAVIVYVWPKDATHIGHASLQVNTHYISFWPADEAGKKDVTIKRSHDVIFMPDYISDCRAEGGREAKSISLYTLDEGAMLEARDQMTQTGCRYNLLKMNCSSFAAALLEFGSKRKPSFVPAIQPRDYIGNSKFGRKATGSIVFSRGSLCSWTPEQLWMYAHELAHGGTAA